MTAGIEGRHTAAPADVLEAYAHGHPDRTRRDEMLDAERVLRPTWRGVGEVVTQLGAAGLAERGAAIGRLLEDDGVTYRAYRPESTGSTASTASTADSSAGEQRWELDPLPLIIDEDDWARLEPAVVQRTELLDEIVTDLYGARRLISSGLLPPEVVLGHAGFLRVADQIRIPGARQLFLSSTDLARDDEGQWRVLADRTQAPSGAGYAMENRSVLSRALPGLYRGTGVHRIAPYFHAMRTALQRVAPLRGDSAVPPRVVLLSPGPSSETAFDQAFLSSLLGLPLAVAADLTVRDGRVWQRSLHRLEPVDVILRRVDGNFCDPLELRPDSQLGVPGLVEAARNGTVSIVNGLGAGVLENPGLYPFLPAICQSLLGEPLRVDSATTYWCGDPISRRHVQGRLDRLVIKPIARTVGSSSRLGWQLSRAERDALAARIEDEPWAWVGQEPLAMSTAPVLIGSAGAAGGSLDPRPVVLRTFAVADEHTYQLMPGGLTRAPADADTLVISNASGAITKDVWVLSSATESGDEAGVAGLTGPETVSAAVSPRVAEDLYWLGRYAERAENLTRLLRVVDLRWRDLHPAPDAALARCLLTLLQALTALTGTWPGFVGAGAGGRLGSPQEEIRSLIADEHRSGTLAHDLARVRSLSNAVRDQLSNDTWIVLSGLDRGLAPFAPRYQGPRALDSTSASLNRLLQAMLAFSGLIAESMVRDSGWYLLDAGRRLERSLQLTGLLRHTLVASAPPLAEELLVESVLTAAESIITHRRRYPARGGVATVLELLLLDPGNPRSLAFQLDRLAVDLEHTPSTEGTARAESELLAGIRERVNSAGLAAVAVSDGAQRVGLVELLDDLHAELRRLHVLIDDGRFTRQGSLQPLDPFSAGETA